ncbi:hypothetical protein HNV12_01070 [Methanococcoides sp. SA1]|nr:hypothetical protein [Methanococcoides sp. SA1]
MGISNAILQEFSYFAGAGFDLMNYVWGIKEWDRNSGLMLDRMSEERMSDVETNYVCNGMISMGMAGVLSLVSVYEGAQVFSNIGDMSVYLESISNAMIFSGVGIVSGEFSRKCFSAYNSLEKQRPLVG